MIRTYSVNSRASLASDLNNHYYLAMASFRPKSSRFSRATPGRRQSVTNDTSDYVPDDHDNTDIDDNESSHSLPVSLPQSLSSQVVFGRYGPDTLRPSASFDSLGALYDAQWSNRLNKGGGTKVVTYILAIDKQLLRKLLIHFFASGCSSEVLPLVCEENTGGRDVSGELLQSEGGEAQQTGNRNPGVTGTYPEPRDCLQK